MSCLHYYDFDDLHRTVGAQYVAIKLTIESAGARDYNATAFDAPGVPPELITEALAHMGKMYWQVCAHTTNTVSRCSATLWLPNGLAHCSTTL